MRSWVLTTLAFLLCAAAGAGAVRADTLPDAAALLARADAAAGTVPPNVREIVHGQGPDGSIVARTFHLGNDTRTIRTVGPVSTETGTSGGMAWQRTANGLTVAVAPDPSPPPAGGTPAVPVVTRSTDPPAYVVSTLDKNGYGTRTFIDPSTAQVIRRDAIDASGTKTTTYADFATYGTATLPRHWTVHDASDGSTMTFERTAYDIGAVKPADVALPGSRDLVTFPAGVAQVTLPTTFHTDKVVVHASIEGHPCDFYLDSGASSIAISPEVARAAGLTTFNPMRNGVNAGTIEQREALVHTLRVGPLELHDVAVTIVPSVAGGPDGQIGLLGFDFLAELGVRIDYERQVVTAVPGTSFVPPTDKNLIELDVRFGTLQPMTSASFDGAIANRLIIDTGSAGTILLFDHFARAHPEVFRNPAPGLGTYLGGVGGFFAVEGWRMRAIRLGAVNFTDFTVYRVDSKHSYQVDEDGLLGYDLLRHFTVVLDYSNGRVFLTPNHGAAASDNLAR
jgi:aspartyl protease family protein